MTDQAKWFCAEQLTDNIRRIWEPHVHRFFRANLFHVIGKDADLIIDFGMGLAPLRPFLNIDIGKPVIALATHVHADHIGSFHEFEHRLGHAAEADGFAGMEDVVTLAHLFRELPQGVEQKPEPSFDQDDYAIHEAPLTTVLAENDTVDIGVSLYKVLHLPGHSPGSIGLLDETSGIFFSGDAIYDGTLVDDLPGCDKSAYRTTMRRLRDLDVSVAYGGHGAPMTRERMRTIANAYLDASAQR
ncbi:MBL fold metallo-hydrolase [Rhizobium anhuiense]|uniref:MBL fold metallo-hydrolase n=2 Tax=Rhizobium anhuiense TaxID=1184720 RepID=A0ABX4IZW0_9HYPH|nr:MBL fold metallo-hydrolase [Rhizobium anhuiense]PDS35058.1 MBL fold metallo-hydrolase [Rhizobium anhuiense]PDS41279.1 MBL fold metallo-hydrolase [Rhizobium anhuiense]PDS48445.1 MBL fold metallo-hydrolase [Rhizobium anhuiense]